MDFLASLISFFKSTAKFFSAVALVSSAILFAPAPARPLRAGVRKPNSCPCQGSSAILTDSTPMGRDHSLARRYRQPQAAAVLRLNAHQRASQ
jgi:hypothetical protein